MSLDECRRGTTFAKEFRQNHHRDIWNCVISITMYSRCPRCWRCYSGLIRSILRWKEKISFRLAPKAISIMLYAIKHSVLYAYGNWKKIQQSFVSQQVTRIPPLRNGTFWMLRRTSWIQRKQAKGTFWIHRIFIWDWSRHRSLFRDFPSLWKFFCVFSFVPKLGLAEYRK